MTIYQIEVRAIAEPYDVQAQQLAHELLHLPLEQLPSLTAISHSLSPLTIRTAQLYHLTGPLTTAQIDHLTTELLVDPVIQEANNVVARVAEMGGEDPCGCQDSQVTRVAEVHGENPCESQDSQETPPHIVDVFFHPGVTDTLAESVRTGARLLGITELEQVETGRRYLLDSRLSETDVRTIADALLYNPVIQQYTLQLANVLPSHDTPAQPPHLRRGPIDLAPLPASSSTAFIPLSSMTDQQLLQLSRTGMLALSLDEMQTIQQHYREQEREPTDVELETLAQTWSEHCSHKTFKATIDYREVDNEGNLLLQETIEGLLKHYIMRATEQLKRPWVVSAFSDNAGIINFTDSQDIAFKVETHNHPSAIEPFGGANTGIGGVIRDVLGVSAWPIACTDILCFGPPDTPSHTDVIRTGVIDDAPVPVIRTDVIRTGVIYHAPAPLPPGILSPRRIASGVINGVRDYGNKMGIPTVNGAILYDPGYICNPLVFCGCLGILPHGSHPSRGPIHCARIQPGDQIVVLGGRTGRDGIHGATFSSGEMSSEINTQAGSAVQIGAPITEKKVADALIQARDRQLYHAITDCGAGGFSSAIGEMGEHTGAWVELAHAPLKYQGLAPWEIWLSEAQERMVLAVPPEHLDELLAICATEEVEANVIGCFTNDHLLAVTYNGQFVADMEMQFLHHGRPNRTLEAIWVRPQTGNVVAPLVGARAELAPALLSSTLLALLSHPTIASKEAVVRRYDHEVQGATILKPLVGRSGNGPSDAAVLQPILDEPTQAGIVLSNGINPLYGKIDPYHMATNAIDEALRNLTAVGGDIERTAILDNFCWGNPTDPLQLGTLVRTVKGCHDAAIGFGTPFISGKDSLNNEYRADGQRLPVIPTLLISAVSVIDNAAQTIDMSLKTPGNLIYQLGITRNELAGSHYEALTGEHARNVVTPLVGVRGGGEAGDTTVPQVDIATARTAMQALGAAIRSGLVQACHDLSEGGLAVAAAEMSLAGMLGIDIDLAQVPMAANPLAEPKQESLPGSQSSLLTILLFSESASRFLIEITPEHQNAFEAHMHAHAVQHLAHIGKVTATDHLIVRNSEQVLIDLTVAQVQEAWKGAEA